MAAELRIGLLGPFSVTVAREDVGPGGSLRRSLPALLALRPGEVVPVDSLVDGLWGDSPPQTATGVLQTYVSTWRKAFEAAGAGPRIATVGAGYRLQLENGESDLSDFAALAAQGRRLAEEGRPSEARGVLADALGLWRGPALADLADRPFHAAAVRPIEERRDRIIEDWAELVLRHGTDDDVPTAAAALDRLRAASPWRERATELLMWALFRQARQHDALELYDDTRRRLDDELGLDPGPALSTMQQRVLHQDPALLGVPGARGRMRHPPRLDSFVGREREVEEVCALLGTRRLVTLSGPGGSGKTRLAEEVAAELAARTGVSTAVVELAPVVDVGLIPGAISVRLDLGPVESVEALAARLADRRLLLVLDNLEQLPDAGPAVAQLLHGTAELRILATSREPLRVSGEHVYTIDPLPVPSAAEDDPARLAGTPSVALLLDRAMSRHGTTAPDAAVTPGIRDVVRALDGLPLALEIVAPWLAVLGPAGLLGELDRRLDLTARLSDVADRHRTLRSAIAWSHDRLTEPEQRLLRRMSVLRGGGDEDAIRAIGGEDVGREVRDLLVDLVERNLVQLAEPVDGRPRFRLLETVRQFEAERLAERGEEEATRLRATEHYARWAVDLAGHTEGPGSDSWNARAVADADNLRAAMDVLQGDGRADEHLQLVVDTMTLWYGAGLESEGLRRMTLALECGPPTASARAMALTFLSCLTAPHDIAEALRLVEEAVETARRTNDDESLVAALGWLGQIARDADTARSADEELVGLADRLRGRTLRYAISHPDSLLTQAAGNLALHARYRSVSTAIAWQQQMIASARRRGHNPELPRHLAELSRLHFIAGDLVAAVKVLQQSQALMTDEVQGRTKDQVATVLAESLRYVGRPQEAEDAARAIIRNGLENDRILHVHIASCLLADLLLGRRELAEADTTLSGTEELLEHSDDLRLLGPLRAYRARWLRLAGRPDEAAAARKETEKGLDPGELSPEHVVWLVESALSAGTDAERASWEERLDGLSLRTGVVVPPWERRMLAGRGG